MREGEGADLRQLFSLKIGFAERKRDDKGLYGMYSGGGWFIFVF